MADGAFGLAAPDGAEPDEVEASRAPLMSHLIELRRRLIVMIAALSVGFVLCFAFGYQLIGLLMIPFEEVATRRLGALPPVQNYPLELFFVRVKLAVFGGLMLAFPLILQQVYAFVAPGLYKRERGAVLPFLVCVPILFAAGIALVHEFIMPLVMGFSFTMLERAEDATRLRFELFLRPSEFLSLSLALMFGFGFAFQLPVVLTLLGKAGIVTPEMLAKNRPFAICGIFGVCMFLTPPDPISLIGLGVIVCLLYELSIFAVRAVTRPAKGSVGRR